jgi:alanyl-tRNA synthetase
MPSGSKQKATKYSAAYLVESFLDYYKARGHALVDSAPLKPEDPTLLFTAAGMVQFKEYYSDPESAPYKTAASVQKCLRAGGKQSDLENVGRTLRHHTFFEMLGNFSFGDYFKQEAIDTAWDLSVNVWKMDPDRIWISVYEDDDDAESLWHKRIGIPKKRIVRLGKNDNFWGPVGDTGICGPSSELYFDTGKERSCGKKTCGPGCDCDRYIEYWNLVFPQFFFTKQGKYDPLPKPGIDTGMGLERVAFILQNAEDNYHTDVFLPIRKAIEDGIPKVGSSQKLALAVNASADHVRALVFALAEGIMPSNEGRGYVLRRLLRRGLTKMHPFGAKEPFLSAAVDAVIKTMGGRYPELKQRGEFIKKVITAEEEHFLSTIDAGWNKLQDVIERGKKNKSHAITGSDAFILYDTYGFPLEMTTELAQDAGLVVDEDGYNSEMAKQKERSRAKSFHGTSGGGEGGSEELETDLAPTEFDGYEKLEIDCDLHLLRIDSDGDDVLVDVVSSRTVFYAESGGQVGDQGKAHFDDRVVEVIDTFRHGDKIAHKLKWMNTAEAARDYLSSPRRARLEVDRETRYATMRNHTATHLLHKALRTVLGEHVTQAGSLVAPDRLRFDFHHFQPMRDGEVDDVVRIVNDKVLEDLDVTWKNMPYKEAIAEGAMALFGEKYADTVRMVTIDGFSKELCGGTHLRHTGEIGSFVIRQETAVAAGVRRIEALTGIGALDYFKRLVEERRAMAERLKVAPDELERRVQALAEETEKLRKNLSEQESRQAAGAADDALDAAEDVGGIQFVAFETGAGDLPGLRKAGDRLRDKMGTGVGLLCLSAGKKPILLIIVSDNAIKDKGLRADDLAKRVAAEFSLRGGGKPHMAQIGLGDPKEFAEIRNFVRTSLGG